MENLDIIILTVVVVIAFIVFIVTSIQEFKKMEDSPYEFERASGITRAALFNLLSSLVDDEELPEKNREKFKSTIKRTISDMETDGVYFNKDDKKAIKKERSKNKSGSKKGPGGKHQ
jgi:hypothetical protein